MFRLQSQCYNEILGSTLVCHFEEPLFTFIHLSVIHLWRSPTCPVCCLLSDLFLSQTVTRRLWHKNTHNWSLFDSQRSHQLFHVRNRAKDDRLLRSILRRGAKMLHCFLFKTYFSQYFSSLSFRKCHQKKCQKNVLPLTQPQPKAVCFSVLFSSWRLSFYSDQQTQHVNICPVTGPVTQLQTNTDTHTHTHTHTGTKAKSLHTLTVQGGVRKKYRVEVN